MEQQAGFLRLPNMEAKFVFKPIKFIVACIS